MSLRALFLGTMAGGLLFLTVRQAKAATLPAGSTAAIATGSYKPPAAAGPYLAAIYAAEDRNRIPRNLLVRLIQKESAFNPKAVSRTGVRGIAQVSAGTAAKPGYGVKPLANRDEPFDSIRFAGEYLAAMYRTFGSWRAALAAYNVGPGQFQKTAYGRDPYGNDPAAYVAYITSAVPVT